MKKLFRIQRLHIFTDEFNTYIVAFDPADAKAAYTEWSGDAWDDSYEPFDIQIPDGQDFSISSYPEDFDDFKRQRPPFSKIRRQEHHYSFSAPAWLWCLWNGRASYVL